MICQKRTYRFLKCSFTTSHQLWFHLWCSRGLPGPHAGASHLQGNPLRQAAHNCAGRRCNVPTACCCCCRRRPTPSGTGGQPSPVFSPAPARGAGGVHARSRYQSGSSLLHWVGFRNGSVRVSWRQIAACLRTRWNYGETSVRLELRLILVDRELG